MASKEAILDGRPGVRWWWFADPIDEGDIDSQLDWVRDNGFGLVEVAWVYPSNAETPPDRVPRLLSERWAELVVYAAKGCRDRGLRCDFTIGSLWPFGGTFVDEADAAMTHRGPSPQRLLKSWESAHDPTPGLIVNHLDGRAVRAFVRRFAESLAPAIRAVGGASLFADSWEVEIDGLWTERFGGEFRARYGYDIEPWLDGPGEDRRVRYDYHRLLSDFVLHEFYDPLSHACRDSRVSSRVQCHGAPADLVAAYASVDIPESETLLFDPPFSLFAASAAAITGRAMVSSETFTCLYGWVKHPGPGPHQGEERIGDLKFLADAVFAAGVNKIIWHGMPFWRRGATSRFYASVHVGPDSAFAEELPAFNRYLTEVSDLLLEGTSVSRLAIYTPLEDAWIAGPLPEELHRPSAAWHWELHYTRPPRELIGYRPLWVSPAMLPSAYVDDQGRVVIGRLVVDAILFCGVHLAPESLAEFVRLAREGAIVILDGKPKQPGTGDAADYADLVAEFIALAGGGAPGRRSSLGGLGSIDRLRKEGRVRPIVTGSEVPPFWARRVVSDDGPVLRLFFAHPATDAISYPMPYGAGDTMVPTRRSVRVEWEGMEHEVALGFERYRSIVLDVDETGAHDRTPEFVLDGGENRVRR